MEKFSYVLKSKDGGISSSLIVGWWYNFYFDTQFHGTSTTLESF